LATLLGARIVGHRNCWCAISYSLPLIVN
jgi:hypothetical protein